MVWVLSKDEMGLDLAMNLHVLTDGDFPLELTGASFEQNSTGTWSQIFLLESGNPESRLQAGCVSSA